MVEVVGVRFKTAGKMYYFSAGDLDIHEGDGVIVETARGMEYAVVDLERTMVSDENVVKPLKGIVRIADEKDIKRHEENESRKAEALRLCQEKINKHGLEMKLIDVEYTFDNNKIVFYFTADGRIDFRELVKDLAGVFRMRIELRQVGVRDEAKMLGGVGCCGRPLCCASWLADFQPVSIKMAKNQNLSLNPTKISGICGRLMCCLKYENDTYCQLRKGMPEVGDVVDTPEGKAEVVESDIIRGIVKVRIFTGEKDDDGQEKLGSDIIEFEREKVQKQSKEKDHARS